MTGESKGWAPSLAALLSGLLFGMGLGISGMTLPAKVIGFLDVTGSWDASLAFVMMGAIGVHAGLYPIIRRRQLPLFDSTFHIPTRRDLDGRLISGAALFGVGWGLGGFCPGPALVSLGSGSSGAALFVVAMLVGMLL
ncbi:MAG: YeeE/YedE family protein, partial [Myxococcales bacterium]|nr:YeeE/YedE family protein [Polyangiaceae bacterium]MDW8249519.1 YeeE/YedE family protein [Myxococcales bacterium]